MNKLLIGVSAPNNHTARTAIATIAEEFCVEHISMRQPVINMIASLTAMDPVHQEFACSPHATVEGLGISIGELEIALAFNLRTIKPDFFIERTKETMGISNTGFNGELFSGQLISGIRTELEAQWVRDQGGVMVHLYHYDNTSEFHALHEMDGDLVVITNSDAPTKNNMAASLAAIQARIAPTSKAA